jgi:hypothetical protein
MKEDLLDNIPEVQLYTTRTIVISSLFGGLPAGSFMIYQNFKSFGDHKKARATILISVLVMLSIMATVFIPFLEKIPGIFYTILTTLSVSLLTKKYQGNLIATHINAEGKIHSGARAVLICLISFLLIAAILFGAFLLQDAAINNL